MIVRAANESDVDWIVGQSLEFAKFQGSSKMVVDTDYARAGLSKMVKEQIVLISENEKERTGFIVAVLGPHPFNPAIKTLTELLWWVAEPFRKSRAGYLLLKEYIRIGKEKADWMTLCSMSNSPLNETVLLRSGFHLAERSYLMEV